MICLNSQREWKCHRKIFTNQRAEKPDSDHSRTKLAPKTQAVEKRTLFAYSETHFFGGLLALIVFFTFRASAPKIHGDELEK